MKRLIPVLFIAAIGLLAFVHFRQPFSVAEPDISRSRVVVPTIDSGADVTETETDSASDDYVQESFITLASGETLITTVTLDIDGDGYEDQVSAIKTASGPYLSLLVGLYNPQTNAYERRANIATQVSQGRTFSFMGLDLTGDHKIALVYQGFLENGNSVLQAFLLQNENGRFSLKPIASLEGDGTIFIQQEDRFESYARSQARGTSFPIWVYTSDSEKPNSTDQIQTRYEWNATSGRYEMAEQIRVTGSTIAEKELSRIQDGTVETFAGFLDGLWYKTETNTSSQRHLFFDKDSNQIIFFVENNEEVYDWQGSTLRRNGMYISSTNLEIVNLQRRIDISLRSVDEIRVRIQDDVRMPVSESSLWDGNYKKLKFSALRSQNQESASQKFIEILKANKWKSSDGSIVSFTNGRYTVDGVLSDTGGFAGIDSAGEVFVQFRSDATRDKIFFKGMYRATISQDEETQTILLEPYIVSPARFYPTEGSSVILTPQK